MQGSDKMVGAIPAMGYGTWNLPAQEAFNGVLWALEAGCRHIDTAQGYNNEEFVGAAIAKSGIARPEIFVTTKVAPENFGPGEVRPSVEASLKKLGVGPVDLLLLHWPSPHNKYPMEDYVAQFAKVFDAGLAKSIGVSNFTIPLLTEAIRLLGKRRIATNQVEIHVFMQNRPIVAHCRSLGIPLTAYCPLARGRVVSDPTLAEIGKAHGATGEQIALAFLIQEGFIVIPSSGKKDRIVSNFAARKIELTDPEMRRLSALDRGERVVNGDWCPKWD